MPTIRYFNQSAPFWEFVASLEDQIADGQLFNESNESSETLRGDSTEKPTGTDDNKDSDENPCAGRKNARGHCGGRGRFPHRGRGGFRSCGGPHGFGGPAFAGIPWAYAWRGGAGSDANNNDHAPPADVFDTEDSYVIHISLAGVKKEDVGINWNADKSELSVAGVIYRPGDRYERARTFLRTAGELWDSWHGDEEFLKTLALDERTVGAFEKKVRIGNERHPAKVDEEAITAKLEDGVLVVTIPKQDKEYVEIKKVDIE